MQKAARRRARPKRATWLANPGSVRLRFSCFSSYPQTLPCIHNQLQLLASAASGYQRPAHLVEQNVDGETVGR